MLSPPQNKNQSATTAQQRISFPLRPTKFSDADICYSATKRSHCENKTRRRRHELPLADVCLRSSFHISSLARDGIGWLSINRRLPKCSRGSSRSSATAPSAAASRIRSRYRASSAPSRLAPSSWSILTLCANFWLAEQELGWWVCVGY